MDEDGGVDNKTNKPWVPAIEDPNYFEVLSPEEIYDSFFSIRRMGFIANRIIRKLNETKHIVSSKILEKRKKLKALQRKQFEQLSPAGIEYLKVLLKMGTSLCNCGTRRCLQFVPITCMKDIDDWQCEFEFLVTSSFTEGFLRRR